MQGFIRDLPYVCQTNARVEVVKELKRKEGVHDEEPRHGTEEGHLGVLQGHGLGLHRPEDPHRYVPDDEERESSTPRHVGDVLLLRRVPS